MTTSEKFEANKAPVDQFGTARKSFWQIWERFGIYLILIVFGLMLTLLSNRFLTIENLSNVMRQVATLALISTGLLTTVTTGKVDLTIGAF